MQVQRNKILKNTNKKSIGFRLQAAAKASQTEKKKHYLVSCPFARVSDTNKLKEFVNADWVY